MALCKRCALNGNQRDGGGLGVCKIHAKSKCRFYGCEAKTLGAEFCAAHAHQEELARWRAKAELRVSDPGDAFDAEGIRREKLQQASFLAHQAVEVFFQSLLEASGALYGVEPNSDEQRKAA